MKMQNQSFLSISAFVRRILALAAQSHGVIPVILSAFIGIATALLAVGFIGFIAAAQHFFFSTVREGIGFLDAFAVILIPALGGLIVGPLVCRFAPEAKGHGVPEVLKAIAVRGSRIRPIVVLVKALASGIAIGSGASVGREGPIVQVGSAIGSTVGQLFKLNEFRIKNFIACGAASGIAAVFNAPIAGVLFSMEVILRDFSARALSTVVVSAVASSIVSQVFLGRNPAFIAPAYSLQNPGEILLYVILGVLCCAAAIVFVTALEATENLFEGWKACPNWIKPAIGGLAVGVIGFFARDILGSGLSTIERVIHGEMGFWLLSLLVLLKITATCLSLGSGSSGGVFAPALFIGAVLGGAFGTGVAAWAPFGVAPAGAYAIAGMASVFSAAAHAPVTAILIVFEMTGDYRMILPIMTSVVIATSLSQLFRKESIYTGRLKKAGIDISFVGEARFFELLRVHEVMSRDYAVVPETLSARQLVQQMGQWRGKPVFVANQNGECEGFVHQEELQQILLERDILAVTAADIASPVAGYCYPADTVRDAVQVMAAMNVPCLPVVHPSAPKRVTGVVRLEDIMRIQANRSAKHWELMKTLEYRDAAPRGIMTLSFRVPKNSPAAGKSVRLLELPAGVTLASIERRDAVIAPDGNTVLHANDRIWAVVIPASEPSFLQWLVQQGINV